jgi:hypothetical protein
LTKYDSVLNLVQEVELKKDKKAPEPLTPPQEELLPPPVNPPALGNAPAVPEASPDATAKTADAGAGN